MTRQSGKKNTPRRQHSQEFQTEALALAEKISIQKATKELRLHNLQLYGWRSKARANQDQSDLEQSLASENARLKRKLAEQAEELAIAKKAATYFAWMPYMHKMQEQFYVFCLITCRVIYPSAIGLYRVRSPVSIHSRKPRHL